MVTPDQHEASKALGKAEERLEQAEHRGHEIMAIAEKLARLGDHADFAARIRDALGGTK
jgi:hypothetical protein